MDDDYGTKPFSVILPKTSTYIKCYDGETKSMHILIKYDELLKSYNDISNKDENSIQKFLQQPINSKTVLKTKKNLPLMMLHIFMTK